MSYFREPIDVREDHFFVKSRALKSFTNCKPRAIK